MPGVLVKNRDTGETFEVSEEHWNQNLAHTALYERVEDEPPKVRHVRKSTDRDGE